MEGRKCLGEGVERESKMGIQYGEHKGSGSGGWEREGKSVGVGHLWDKPESWDRGGSWEDMKVTLAES